MTTTTNKTISEDEFYATYKPVKNPFVADASWGGAMLETYGRELAHVEEVLKTAPDTVWTVLDCDGALIVGSGFHHVNRLGYIITEVPVAAGESVETIDEDAGDDEGDDGEGGE
jgi:hypothetical protein